MARKSINERAGQMRKSILAVLIVTVLLATAATFFGARGYFERTEFQAASNRVALYLRTLNETLRQHQHLPFVLARDPRFSDAVHPQTAQPKTNDRLKLLAQEAKLEAVYLMNGKGLVVAASNAEEPHSFLGQNYGFRPYFQQALQGKRSDYFAIGATSGRPGYFVAEPVSLSRGTQRGVIAIKLDVSELQQSWENSSETVVALNEDKIVVLASNPDWLYRPVSALDPNVRNAILGSRQFGTEPLKRLPWQSTKNNRVIVDGVSYLMTSGASDWRGWTVHYLQNDSVILRRTLLATGFFGSIVALLVGFSTYLRSRRIGLAFAESERQRGALEETNLQLEQAQTELGRNAKLAALGHLAASVTHELGQPISAFRNHLTAAEMSNEITSPTTAANLNKLVDRMEAITGQFRYFARGRVYDTADLELAEVLKEAESLVRGEIDNGGIAFTIAQRNTPTTLTGNKILLEQAFTNLFKNAIHAVADVEKPGVAIDVVKYGNRVEVRVADNGRGISGVSLAELQEPFFSTKPSGVGMGLGLAIATEIIKEHGGNLRLGTASIGAEFIASLPLKPKEGAS